MNLNHNEILELEKYYRINLINQITGLKSANLIGTQNDKGVANLAIFNTIVHLGAHPPCLGFVMRPLLVDRHTYKNIHQTKYFTVNQVYSDIISEAHHTSAKYQADESEFDYTDLEAMYIDDFQAPFVAQSKIKLGLSYLEEHEIKYNGTIFIAAKIEKLIIDEEYLDAEGHVLHEKLGTVAVSGLDTYYSCNKISRENYARPQTIKTNHSNS